jgi:hypothetical protein
MKTIIKHVSTMILLSGPILAQNNLDVDVVPSKNKDLLKSILAEEDKRVNKLSVDKVYVPSSSMPKAKYIGSSLILKAAAGASTAKDSEITQLQSGFHDPRRRGFTFQAGEFSLAGAVDPYFKAEMHANFSESAVELEEAFITTTSLPYKMELEIGYFLTEFGRKNPAHAHVSDFADQALIKGRLFGGEGQRATGFRLGKLLPLSWMSEIHVGMQSSVGGLTSSFRSTATTTIGGRPTVTRETSNLGDMITLLRWVNAATIGKNIESQLGFSYLAGPNSTGNKSETSIIGADFVLRWDSPKQRRGYPFFVLEIEGAKRTFEAASGVQNGFVYGSEDLTDWAYIIEGVYGFAPRWRAGLRYEQAGGEGASFSQLRSADSARSDRTRFSPMLTFRATEFSKLTFQVNFDDADHLTDKTHTSFWLSAEVLIGSHPAHNF